MTAARRLLVAAAPAVVIGALALLVFGGKGRVDLRSAGGDPEGCGVEPSPSIGLTVPIVQGTGDEYGVSDAVQLADGGVLFARDANVEEAGGDTEQRQPALI